MTVIHARRRRASRPCSPLTGADADLVTRLRERPLPDRPGQLQRRRAGPGRRHRRAGHRLPLLGTARRLSPTDLEVIERVATSPAPCGRATGRRAFEADDVTVEAHRTSGWAANRLRLDAARGGAAHGQGRRGARPPPRGVRASPTGRSTRSLPVHPARASPSGRSPAALERRMLDLGAEGSRSTRSSRAGRTARSRTTAPDRRLERGDLVKMDFGALYRRLPRRHDPHRRGRRARGLAARALRPGLRRPAGRAGARCGRRVPLRRASTPPPATVIEAAGYGTSSRTASGTASAWRSTRHRCLGPGVDRYTGWTAFRSPSSPGSTSPAAAVSASRTRSWSRDGRRRSCSPPRPRSCSSL